MSLKHLTADWQHWVTENIERGCPDDSMLPLLMKGGYTENVARQSIIDARSLRATAPVPEPTDTPAAGRLDLSVNRVALSDGQEVRISAVLIRPLTVLFENILSAAETDALIQVADERLAPSTVIDPQLGQARPHQERTSDGAWFARCESPLIERIDKRLAELLKWPLDHGEGLQVLRYATGGQYTPHFDYFDPALPGNQRHLSIAGQRIGTLIMYLSDVERGGETVFPNTGLAIRPQRGAGVYFENVDPKGLVDPATLHGGTPVVQGVKYIATKWLRERPYK
jgi:prolyl 4-hydroxylase